MRKEIHLFPFFRFPILFKIFDLLAHKAKKKEVKRRKETIGCGRGPDPEAGRPTGNPGAESVTGEGIPGRP